MIAQTPRTVYRGNVPAANDLAVVPRTVYKTQATPTSTSYITGAPVAIFYHDNSNITLHDGNHLAIHSYFYFDVPEKASGIPRLVYSGSVESA